MVRWARRSLIATEKRPHDASSWSELKSSSKKPKTEAPESRKYDKNVNENVMSAAEFRLQNAGSSKKSAAVLEKGMMLDFMKRNHKREKRRQKRVDTREKDTICFKCREKGHDMASCPKMEATEEGAGICFKCGSTEHSLKQCRVKGDRLAYAKCFICKETGHLSKQCPDNPRGLYPNGGCCRECGSVEHYRKDCPDLQQQQVAADLTIERIDPFASVDAEPVTHKKTVKPSGPKIVNFK
ncbi:zinc finger CCHC domain-containing protein 9 [Octopus bimaculoides]|uniref:CCHC-type domain-containing protein n=1 Tax=Octopus bimaculoides TaxID=37653 RepID=A0A0L8FY52_OCTBM|nr:zinc finger CCHC domain-containing protein 9 [Octopus bimaculoides]XP_014786083.1 zinc finger CCHC domain-containing protein 9 [Octopus bimaculoides]|eukprot:XP_014786082.1 PREDICTED: zinc finger CCHC domain-containing protein 9-like [Octopus bimaculoides]